MIEKYLMFSNKFTFKVIKYHDQNEQNNNSDIINQSCNHFISK